MEVLFSRSRYFLTRVQILVFRTSLNCSVICVTLLMLEQAKRGTPETSVCTFILPLNCLPSCSIRLLSLS